MADRWPDDTEDELYIHGEITLTELTERINQKWFGVDHSQIRITAIKENLYGCHCCPPGYSDFGEFICVERIKE